MWFGPGGWEVSILTAEPVFGVVEPLWRLGADVGLGSSVGHGVDADPGRQVDVEAAGVDDAVGVHEPLAGQLQIGEEREASRERGISGSQTADRS